MLEVLLEAYRSGENAGRSCWRHIDQVKMLEVLLEAYRSGENAGDLAGGI